MKAVRAGAGLALMMLALSQPALAQQPLNRVLAAVTVADAGSCRSIDIGFNQPVTLGNRFPAGSASEIQLGIGILGTTQTPDGPPSAPEAATIAIGNAAGLQSVVYDPATTVSNLVLSFDHDVRYGVSPGSSPNHIVVLVAEPGSTAACLAEAPGGGSPATASDPLAEARKSLAQGDPQRAIALLTKAVTSGPTAARADAQEMLGLAYERAGQLAHAKAEYEAYLRSYPKGAGAGRVKERLSGVLAAMETEAQAEFAARKKAKLASTGGELAATVPKTLPGTIQGGKQDRQQPQGWTWEKSGSVGQTYYRDDGFAGAGLLRGTLGDHDVGQNDIVSSGDMTLRGKNGSSEITARLSATEYTGLDTTYGDATRVSAAYVDMRDRLNGLSARIGRQTRSSGGVFGRFDGALLGWAASDQVLLQLVAGSPVYYGDDTPFADDRYFVGASVDLTSASKLWAGTLYAIEQNVGQAVDRRAIGGELRYTGARLSGYSGLDYDVYYKEINDAYVSGTWDPIDALSLYGSLDYRRVPFLLTSNALMGQPTSSLAELIDLFGSSDVQSLAVDRTATAATATAGLSYDLNQAWQIAFEASAAKYSGTPASGGVDAMPAPGTEYYVSAHLYGSDIFREGDSAGLSLMFVDSQDYQSYIADLSLRLPLNERWRIIPRLRAAYRSGSGTSVEQVLVMPSLGFSYRVSPHWEFDGEGAVQWQTGGSGDSTDLRLNLGYRYLF